MSWDEPPDDPHPGDPRDSTPVERAAAHLRLQLPGLVERRVPVRGLTPGPVHGVGRLRLADSTTYLVGSVSPGDLGRLTRSLHDRRSITLAGWESTPAGLLLTLGGTLGRDPVRLWLLGPDQPD